MEVNAFRLAHSASLGHALNGVPQTSATLFESLKETGKTLFIGSAAEGAARSVSELAERAVSKVKDLSPAVQIGVGVLSAAIASFALYHVAGLARRTIVRALLSKRGWLYRRDASLRTKIQFALIKILCGQHPKLYDLQEFLPSLPVPSLDKTMFRFFSSMKPLLSPQELQTLQAQMLDFQKPGGVGRKLQLALQFRRLTTVNWLEEFWEKYVYLMSRDPLPINSNIYGMDSDPEMTPGFLESQPSNETKPRGMKRSSSLSNLNLSGVERGSFWIVGCLQFKKLLDTQVLRNTASNRQTLSN